MAQPAASSLLEHAVAAVQNIHAVQVGLAKAGADDGALKAVGQCAEIMSQVTKALGSGPALDQSSGGQPGAGGPPQSQPAPQPQAGPPAPAAGPPEPAQHASGAPVGNQKVAHHAMRAASSALQSAMAASPQK